MSRRSLNKLLSIMDNPDHPLHNTVQGQRSSFSDRLIQFRCHKERFKKSFLPFSIKLFNDSPLSHRWCHHDIICFLTCSYNIRTAQYHTRLYTAIYISVHYILYILFVHSHIRIFTHYSVYTVYPTWSRPLYFCFIVLIYFLFLFLLFYFILLFVLLLFFIFILFYFILFLILFLFSVYFIILFYFTLFISFYFSISFLQLVLPCLLRYTVLRCAAVAI